jgi:hypothetical protein
MDGGRLGERLQHGRRLRHRPADAPDPAASAGQAHRHQGARHGLRVGAHGRQLPVALAAVPLAARRPVHPAHRVVLHLRLHEVAEAPDLAERDLGRRRGLHARHGGLGRRHRRERWRLPRRLGFLGAGRHPVPHHLLLDAAAHLGARHALPRGLRGGRCADDARGQAAAGGHPPDPLVHVGDGDLLTAARARGRLGLRCHHRGQRCLVHHPGARPAQRREEGREGQAHEPLLPVEQLPLHPLRRAVGGRRHRPGDGLGDARVLTRCSPPGRDPLTARRSAGLPVLSGGAGRQVMGVRRQGGLSPPGHPVDGHPEAESGGAGRRTALCPGGRDSRCRVPRGSGRGNRSVAAVLRVELGVPVVEVAGERLLTPAEPHRPQQAGRPGEDGGADDVQRHRPARHIEVVLQDPHRGLQDDPDDEPPGGDPEPPVDPDGEQAGEQADRHTQVEVHGVGVQVRDLDEFDLQPVRRQDLLVTGVRPGTGRHRPGDEHHRQRQGRDPRRPAQGGGHGRTLRGGVRLGDLHDEHRGEEGEQHRRQEVRHDHPPGQVEVHGDPADHRLDDDADALEEGDVQQAAAAGRADDREEGEDRRDRDDEGEQPVTELDGLVQCGGGARFGHQGAGLALRPGRAAESGPGDAHEGAGEGDAALAEQEDEGVEPLAPHRRDAEPGAQPHDRGIEHEHRPVGRIRGRRPGLQPLPGLGCGGRRGGRGGAGMVRRGGRHGAAV